MKIRNNLRAMHDDRNPTEMKKIRCCLCKYNVLHDLKYCYPAGLNHSLPPDILHALLFGYVTRLINRFVWLKQKNSEKLFVFSETFRDEVE